MNFLESIAIQVLKPLFAILTPEIKAELQNFLQTLYTKAKATSSPLDDFAIALLAGILGVTVE